MLRQNIPHCTTQVKSKPQNSLAEYCAYFVLVSEIDEHLTRRTRHFRNRKGKLLLTLDQVVNALLAGEIEL